MNQKPKTDSSYRKKKRPRIKLPTKVIDNIPEGGRVDIDTKLFVELFGDEILRLWALREKNKKSSTEKDKEVKHPKKRRRTDKKKGKSQTS